MIYRLTQKYKKNKGKLRGTINRWLIKKIIVYIIENKLMKFNVIHGSNNLIIKTTFQEGINSLIQLIIKDDIIINPNVKILGVI